MVVAKRKVPRGNQKRLINYLQKYRGYYGLYGHSEVRIWLAKCRASPLASLGQLRFPNTLYYVRKTGGKNEMENRTRPYAYTFRASENERKIIDEKVKASGLTMTDFIVKAITDKPVIVFKNAGETLNELKRQGNNLNQLVKKNYYGMATKRDILSCVDELKNTYKAITKAIGES